MLTGKALGAAIKAALEAKEISQAELAREFDIKPPSIAGWIKTGRISKPNFERLREFVSDKIGPDHWGLPEHRRTRQVQSNRAETYNPKLSSDEVWLVQAYRKASKDTRTAMLAIAQSVIPTHPDFKKRTGT